MDLLSVGTASPAPGSLRTLSGRGGRAEPLPPVTAADDLFASYADLVERYVDGAPAGLGQITPHQLVNLQDRAPFDGGPPVELDGLLLSHLLELYLVDGWAGLRAYDEGWRKLTEKSPAPGGTSDAEASPEATPVGRDFYALTRELITVAISNALETIASAASVLVQGKLRSCLDAVAAASATFGFRPGDPPTVDASLPATKAAVTAFREAERTGRNFVYAAHAYAGISELKPSSIPAQGAALPRAREDARRALDRTQQEYAVALQTLIEIAPFLAGHVRPEPGKVGLRSSDEVTKLMAKLLAHLEARLRSMQGEALDAASVLPYRSVTGGKGWLGTYPAEAASARGLTPMPVRGPETAVIELAGARSAAPVWSAVTSPDVLDLLVTDERLGELERLVLQRLRVEVATLHPAAPAKPAGEQQRTVGADDLAGAIIGLAGLAVRTGAMIKAGAVVAGLALAKAVLLYVQMYRDLDDAEIQSVVTAAGPTDYLYGFGVIQGRRDELTREVARQVVRSAAEFAAGSVPLFGPALRLWGATQDAYVVVTYVRESVR
ncbi:hypothetical protein ACI784_09120 [Geodermatophilus sp. SYSU D01186]